MKNNYGIDEKYLLLLGFKQYDKTDFEKYYKTPIGLFSLYINIESGKFSIYTYSIKNKSRHIESYRQLKINRLPKILSWFEKVV